MPAQSMFLCVLSVVFCLFNGFSTHAFAQIPGEMRFQKGQKFRFQVDHKTEVTDSQGETKTTVKNTVLVTKLLEILSVDEATRSATITLKLEKLKMETVRPNGQILAFDSESTNKDDSPLGKSLAPLIGKDTRPHKAHETAISRQRQHRRLYRTRRNRWIAGRGRGQDEGGA